MVRDFDLIRRILLEIQAMPAGSHPVSVRFDGEYDQDAVNEHIELLIEAGLVSGNVTHCLDGGSSAFVSRLTWDGHDFLRLSADDTIWSKARDIVIKPAAAFTFDVLKEWLKKEAMIRLGIA